MFIDFNLPEELIATHPSEKRDGCKILVFDRSTEKISHLCFNDLPQLLNSDYFLVLNQARVNPVRMFWLDKKGKKQELLFLKHLHDQQNNSIWEAIVSGKNLKINQPYIVENDFEFILLKDRENSMAHVQVNKTKLQVEDILATKGQLPIPPYILKKRKEFGSDVYTKEDEKNYQTTFSKKSGAVAAPTAGLHFSEETFVSLKEKNIGHDFIHLSVGWGTFAPLTQKQLDEKKLHSEFCEIPQSTAQNILSKKKDRKKILAVGTTTVRALETWANRGLCPDGFQDDTEILISPPYDFQVVDAMLTNFHIPKSSLLLMVAAFLGKEGDKKILEIYKEAIEKKYKFYSYGDCMLIL